MKDFFKIIQASIDHDSENKENMIRHHLLTPGIDWLLEHDKDLEAEWLEWFIAKEKHPTRWDVDWHNEPMGWYWWTEWNDGIEENDDLPHNLSKKYHTRRGGQKTPTKNFRSLAVAIFVAIMDLAATGNKPPRIKETV